MSIIDKIKSSTLSFEQLKNMVGPNESKKCRWLLYDELKNYKTIEDLLELGACIILLQIETPRAPKVGHFILLLNHGTYYEHFDSYGLTFDEELNLTQEKHLTQLFNQSRKKIENNTKRLQMFREDINTCGRWCVARFLLRSMNLNDFINLFNHLRSISYDDQVTAMCLLLPLKN